VLQYITKSKAQIEEGDLPKHIRHNEESHMRPPNVNLIEMTDSPVSRSNGNILELDIHIIFGYSTLNISTSSIFMILRERMS
jgi:hypothetical protein